MAVRSEKAQARSFQLDIITGADTYSKTITVIDK